MGIRVYSLLVWVMQDVYIINRSFEVFGLGALQFRVSGFGL